MLSASAADGSLSVVICTSHGREAINLDADGTPAKPEPARSDSGLCPYAASTPVALAVATFTAVESQPAVAVIAFPASVDPGHAELHGGATSARGPPLLA
jgi:hypothetical protein